MKKITYTAFICLLASFSMQAQNNESKLKTIAQQFIEATDIQDAEMLGATMHDQSMQYVLFGPKVLVFTKEEYMSQLKAKKVGGLPRSIDFGDLVSTANGLATLELTATSSKLKFHYQISFLQVAGKWLITSINTEVVQL